MLVWSRNGYDLHTRNWYPPCFGTCLHPKSPRNRAIPLSFGAATAALLEKSCVKCGWCQMMACHPWICQISLKKQYKNECIRPYWIMDWRSLKCRSHLLYDCYRIILDKLAMKKSAILDSEPELRSETRCILWWIHGNPSYPSHVECPKKIGGHPSHVWHHSLWHQFWPSQVPGQQLVSSDIVMG